MKYQNVPELIESVIHYVCPMCKLGEPLDAEGYHPKGQHCYARMLRKIIERYECQDSDLELLSG